MPDIATHLARSIMSISYRTDPKRAATTGDECFLSMQRHHLRTHPVAPLPVPGAADLGGSGGQSVVPATSPGDDPDLAWGAREVAIAMFGKSPSAEENKRR